MSKVTLRERLFTNAGPIPHVNILRFNFFRIRELHEGTTSSRKKKREKKTSWLPTDSVQNHIIARISDRIKKYWRCFRRRSCHYRWKPCHKATEELLLTAPPSSGSRRTCVSEKLGNFPWQEWVHFQKKSPVRPYPWNAFARLTMVPVIDP